MSSNSAIQQASVFFSGIVQGVGFRYNAQRYAVQIGLKGWVKNLSDGRVEACVLGTKAEIEDFCRRLKLHYDGSIQSVDVGWNLPNDSFEDFRIIS